MVKKIQERTRPLNLRIQREPLVDVVEEEGDVKVIAELPGMDKKDIQLFTTERILTINVNTSDRKYFKELDLPFEVDESTARSMFRNGILSIVLKKKKDRGKGTRIKIE